MTLGQRVAVMRDGVLQQVGTPAEPYGRPANRVVAGLRPEAMRHGAAPEPAAARFRAMVQLVEVHGADTHVHIVPAPADRAPAVPPDASGPVIARLDGSLRPAVGDVLDLWATAKDVHLFDTRTGVAVRAAGR